MVQDFMIIKRLELMSFARGFRCFAFGVKYLLRTLRARKCNCLRREKF